MPFYHLALFHPAPPLSKDAPRRGQSPIADVASPTRAGGRLSRGLGTDGRPGRGAGCRGAKCGSDATYTTICGRPVTRPKRRGFVEVFRICIARRDRFGDGLLDRHREIEVAQRLGKTPANEPGGTSGGYIGVIGFQCRRARKWARLSAAGCLSDAEHARLSAHIGRCAVCRFYASELKTINESLLAWEASTPAPRVTPELSAQWNNAIKAETSKSRDHCAPSTVPAAAPPVWFGLDRALPVSLALLWLIAIGLHLNTPPIRRAPENLFVPTWHEVHFVMEWLVGTR